MKGAVCVAIGLLLMTVSLPVIPPRLGVSLVVRASHANTKSEGVTSGRRLPSPQAKAAKPQDSQGVKRAASSGPGTQAPSEKPRPSPKPTEQPQPAKATADAFAESVPAEDKLCSLNVVEGELASILRTLSEQTGANLVLLSAPGAKLTLRLANVPLRDMIRHICALAGLAHLEVGSAFVLATEEQLKKGYPKEWELAHPAAGTVPDEPRSAMVTHRLSHISAAQAAETLAKVFGPNALTVAVGPGASSPELSIRETSQVTGLASGAIEKGSQDGSQSSKTLVLWGATDVVSQAVSLLTQLDQPRQQVVISVSIHDINNEALKELGLTWTFGDVSVTESDPGNLAFGSFSRSGVTFVAALKALERDNRAKLLASPTVSVLDGEKAFILIGQRVNYPVLVGFTQVGAPIFSREQERIGIYLQVSVNVSESGEITLVLYPQVSTVTGFLEVNGASYPQIATREAQTTLRLRNGETLVMGGLLKDEQIVDVQKVPFLADIPILGELFKRRKTSKSSSQVVIAITPQLIGTAKP